MAIYIVQGRYTTEGIKGMIANPEDRAPALRALLEGVGAKLKHYFVTFGEYDFLTIAEGPSGKESDMMAALVTAAGSGGVTHLKTTVAVTSADAKTAFEKAKKLSKGFKAAGRKA